MRTTLPQGVTFRVVEGTSGIEQTREWEIAPITGRLDEEQLHALRHLKTVNQYRHHMTPGSNRQQQMVAASSAAYRATAISDFLNNTDTLYIGLPQCAAFWPWCVGNSLEHTVGILWACIMWHAMYVHLLHAADTCCLLFIFLVLTKNRQYVLLCWSMWLWLFMHAMFSPCSYFCVCQMPLAILACSQLCSYGLLHRNIC